MDFVEYPENIFWMVGATGVLVKYNATKQETTILKHTPGDSTAFPVTYDIREIFIDLSNMIWMGSKHGLITFNPAADKPVFRSYHTTDGLPSEKVYRIDQDKAGKLWCATQNGISRFDPATGSFRNYSLADGLANSDINGAMSISFTGKIFIGHSNFIQYFDPALLGNSNYCGPVRLTGIKVLGKDYTGDFTPSYTDTVKLSYKQNEVTISFAMINFAVGDQTTYDYFLEGLNEEWIPIGKNHSVTFTNLDGGTYRLHVRGYNADGICGDGESVLTLIVTPPFWKTKWFFILLFVLVSAGIFSYVRIRLHNLNRTKRELQAMVAKRTEQLEIEKNRAEQSEKFKQQFLANMSHEIRTPMNAVIGMTNLLIDNHPRSDQDYYLHAVKRSSETLLHIINDILDLSKIEAGKVELEKIDFSLQEVIKDVMQVLHYKADEKAVQLIADIDDIPVLVGDPVRLYQVLINLAGNAVKFTERGSVQIVVRKVNADADQIAIWFSIIDTGIGIPREKLDFIFENFTQAHTSDTRKYGGTGLGLSISKQLIELLGGKIQIESEEGTGTTFSFQLQFEKGSSERLNQHFDPDHDIDGSILDGLNILIAEDNEYNRIVATDTLRQKARVTIHHATTGKEVISIMKEKHVDVILMDEQMPEMNGFEATRIIRNQFSSPQKDIPVIALTASVLRSDLSECKVAGMNAYIPKPFTTFQLISGIAEVLHIPLRTVPKKKQNIKTPVLHNGVTNLTYLLNFCEGDMERAIRYILVFLKSAPLLSAKIVTALKEKNYNEIADQVHSYKTTWVMMGMKSSKELAAKIEAECREQNGNNIDESVMLLVDQITKAIKELREYQK